MKPSLDELITRVNLVASQLSIAPELPAVPPTITALSGDAPHPPEPVARDGYQLLEFFLPSSHQQFLEFAYRTLFGREIDESGLAHYLGKLADGATRLEVIGALRRSPEAQRANIQIIGIWRARLAFFLANLPRRLKFPLLREFSEAQDQRLAICAAPLRSLQRGTAYTTNQLTRLSGIPREIEALGAHLVAERKVCQELKTKLRELERTLALHRSDLITRHMSATTLPLSAAPPAEPEPYLRALDAYYVAFEDFHRGSETEIRDKLTPYLGVLADIPPALGPLLDVGCGRGEWLTLLQEQGISARGIDMNPAMIAICQQTGLDAQLADAVSYLDQQANGSLGAITAFHVVEHLPFPTLYRFMIECLRTLHPGGLLVLETPNPENLLVGAHTFYHDFSHRNPVTPSALDFLARHLGFVERRILRLHPYPPSDHLPGRDAVSERINGHLYGPQDYALIARKPDGGPI